MIAYYLLSLIPLFFLNIKFINRPSVPFLIFFIQIVFISFRSEIGPDLENLNEIIQLPIDMNCMNSALVKRLAGKLSLYELNDLQDKKDKLTSKLFMKKLEFLFEEEHNMLHRCVNCNSLYTNMQREWMHCPKANIFIDFHGNVVAKH